MSKFSEDGEIRFEEDKHEYFDKSGNKFISVSTLIHKFTPPFDPDGKIAERCAIREGITTEEMKERWAINNVEACNKGTQLHSDIENFFKKGIYPKGPNRKLIKQFAAIEMKGEVKSEIIVYSKKYRIAGQVDLIDIDSRDFAFLYDAKTNKKIEKYSIFGNKMLHPFSYLYSTNFTHYSLQLNLYAQLIEDFYGYWVRSLDLLHVNPKTLKLEKHSIKFLPKETKVLLESAKQFWE